MLRKYLPDDDAREQLRGMKTGLWIEEHGVSASWQNLLDALQMFIDLCENNKWDEAGIQWNKQVGGAQRLLPAHVINEYCHPTRSFDPCPNFTVIPIPRIRQTDEGDWYTVTCNKGALGETFAVVRWSFDFAMLAVNVAWLGAFGRPDARVVGGMGGAHCGADYLACQTLLITRTQQRDELIAELDPPLRPKACPGGLPHI